MAPNVVLPHIADLFDWVGKSLGHSSWHQISQEQINAFAEATNDHQWIHVDPERAKRESPFGSTIAHGNLTLCLVPTLFDELILIEDKERIINYGVDKARYTAPIPAGARIRLHATVKDVRDIRGGAARVIYSVKFEVEGQAKSACTADVIYVYYPKD